VTNTQRRQNNYNNDKNNTNDLYRKFFTKLRTKFLRTILNLLNRVAKAYITFHVTVFFLFSLLQFIERKENETLSNTLLLQCPIFNKAVT